jgi:hypothetical protein
MNYIPWGDYVLKDVFYWIEVKKQTLFFVVILFFVLIHVKKKRYASKHIVVHGKFVILTGIPEAAMFVDFKSLAA